MIDVAYSRDLVMIGAIFGLAAFIWSGWAQEAPPRALVWRLVLAVVFGQPVLHLAGLLLTIVAVVTFILPRETAAPSFWCGILGAPVFLGIGLWCLLAGRSALSAG